MIIVLGIMVLGIVLGYLLRSKKNFIKISERASMYAIYLLLMFLGISVGLNEKVLNQFGNLGFKAIVLSLSGVTGSVILALLVFKWLKFK